MKSNFRRLTAFLLLVGAVVNALSYSVITGPNGNPTTWDDGVVSMTIKLGNSTTLQDGSNYNTSVQAAMNAWNGTLSRVQFSGSDAGSGTAGSANGINEIAFSADVFGEAFGTNVLAVTVSYRSATPRADGTNRRTQSDIVFNTAYTWNSYTGARQTGIRDIRRVALHELGHVLGLDHPDEAGQSVTAIMNSTISDVYLLQGDDISGGQSLYGAPGSTATAPAIVTQPTNLSVASGSSVSFAIAASGSTPLTYRWQWAPSGSESWTNVPTGGYYYSGVTSSRLYVYPDLTFGGNKYRCIVANSAGSATSDAATLTVTGTAPTLSSSPSNTTIVYSTNASFSAYFYGSAPLTYGWQVLPAGSSTWADLADNTVYSGTKTTYLTLTAPPQSYTGNSYRCVANNPLGSANSTAAVLTITPAVAPTISLGSSSATLDYGSSLSLYANVSGSPSPTVQWKKDGVSITGATSWSYYKSSLTPADSGSYTITATNVAGTITSSAVVITVRDAVGPAITTQPTGVEVTRGNSFSLSVSVSGSPSMSYQWYRGGQAINGATSSYYSVSAAAATDAGLYTVKATNSVGSVTSNAVEVVVLPVTMPVVTSSGGFIVISPQNNSFTLWPNSKTSGPTTYQWFKDGVPVTTALSSSDYLSRSGLTFEDAGEYVLVVTNEAGMAVSRPWTVSWQSTVTSRPWLDSARVGDIVYFLASSPSRIMRYDMAREAWLPIAYLPEGKVATSFLPTASGVFIAYGKQVVRRSLDNQTEVPVYTGAGTVSGLNLFDQWLIFAEAANSSSTEGSAIVTVDATTLASSQRYSSYAAALGRGQHPAVSSSGLIATSGVGNGEIWSLLKINSSGVIDSSIGSLPYYSNRYGTQRYFSPNEALIFDDAGQIYDATSLAHKGSVGLPFDSAAFRDDGTLVLLRGKSLRIYSAGDWRESGEALLPELGTSVFARGSASFVFSLPADATSNPVVRKVVTADFRSALPPQVANPTLSRFSIDDAFLDAHGVLNVVSGSARGIIRWDPSTKTFLPTVPLRQTPSSWNYAPSYDRLAIGSSAGFVTDVDFSATTPVERLVGHYSPYNTLLGISAVDAVTWLNIYDYGISSSSTMALTAEGALAWRSSSNSNTFGLFWDSANRRLYNRYGYDGTQLSYTPVAATGLPTTGGVFASNLPGPWRFSAEDGLILAGNGRIVNFDFQQVATLPNTVVDGAWLSDAFFTIRTRPEGTQVQKWTRVTYQANGTLTLTGVPLKIMELTGSTLLVVTSDAGYLTMHIVNSDLTVASTTSNRPPAIVTNRAPTASLVLSSERGMDQTMTVTVALDDADGNLAYANLWVNTPKRGWLALRADGSLVASSTLSAANAVASSTGTHRRRFTFTPTDGPGTYTFAMAAVDAAGARTDVANQYVTVTAGSHAPQASFTLSSQRAMNAPLTIQVNVQDEDGDYAYANLWIKTPNRGWLALKADGSLVASAQLSAENSVATTAGTHTRTFTFTPTDGAGVYTFALAAIDAQGQRGDAAVQTITAGDVNHAPTASFTLSSERKIEQTLTINVTVDDADGDYAYANLWVRTPNRGWMAIKADSSIVLTSSASAANTVAPLIGTVARTFPLTLVDGPGTYTIALSAFDTNGARTDAPSQTITVEPSSAVVGVWSSSYVSLALRADGTLVGAGANGSGALTSAYSTSNSVLRFSPIATDVATARTVPNSSEGGTLYLKTDGSLYGVGSRGSGALATVSGQGGTPGLVTTDVMAMAAGYSHMLLLKLDGELYSAGYNSSGQLGDGTYTYRYNPARIAGGVVAVAAGRYHSVFLKSDGTLWACGSNDSGQLGDGTTSARETPVQVAANVVAISASDYNSYFVKADGTLWGTGSNSYYQLAQGDSSYRSTPVQIATGVTNVFAGPSQCMFLKTNGSLWGIGYSSGGELGSSTYYFSSPVQLAPAVRSAAVYGVGLVARTDGTLSVSGYNYYGSLGLGDTNTRYTYTDAIGGVLPAPTAPTTVRGTNGVASPNIVAWVPVAAAASYEIWRSTSNDSATATKIGTTLNTAFGDATAQSGMTYYYWVKSVNATGTSGFSTSVSAGGTVNTAPAASFTLSSERAIGQTITVTSTVSDTDGNFAYANLWVKTPKRGWLAIKSNTETVATSALGSAHAFTATAGTFSRTFALTTADGPGTYMFALAAVDAAGATTFATSQYITVTSSNVAPTASLSLSSQRVIGQTITITGTVGDTDNNLAYVDLWVKTPNRGWLAIKSDSTTTATDSLGAAHATTTSTGTFTRTFALTNTDGVGSYMFALAAVDSEGAVTFAPSQYITVTATSNTAPTASFTLSSERALGQTITITGTVGDTDNNLAYVDLWVKTPNRGWMAIKSDSTTTATDALGAAHATTTSTGTFTRTFALTNADGVGSYMFALAAVDSAGAVTFATSQYITVEAGANTAPTASFTLSSERNIGETITITGTVTDLDGNFAYADLWVMTPNRGWLAVKSDNTTTATGSLGAAHATTTTAGTFTRTFTFTSTDGAGSYLFALAAVDASGAITFALNQHVTVANVNHAPTASVEVSGGATHPMGDVLVIKVTADDVDGNFAYGNLWIKTPNRGWLAIKSDDSTVATGNLGAAHATMIAPGTGLTRTFTLSNTDGVGSYIIAFAATDSAGLVTFASNIYFTVVSALRDAPAETTSGYAAWAQAHFAPSELADPKISAPDAIYGSDGLTNLLKYALGLHPKQDGTAALPETTTLDDHWFYTYRRPANVNDVTYRVEVSTDLINWTDVGVTQEMATSDSTWQTWQAQYHGIAGQTVVFRLVPILN